MDNSTQDIEIVVKVNRSTVEERELASITFEGLTDDEDNDVVVDLADSEVSDIKILFDSLFTKIHESKAVVKFKLDDSKSDLYNQVTKDIIAYLEKEIEQSQDNFQKIWDLVDDQGDEE